MRLHPVAAVISLQDIGVSLGGQTILRGLHLTVTPGQVLGVAGPNGSGKTTLLRLLATLLSPSRGQATVLGAALGSPSVYDVRRSIGLMSHIPAVIGELTLRENLDHVARLVGESETRVDAALRVVGLDEVGGRRADASSFGMLRRTEAARLLLTRPRLLLLDEAFSGLDVEAQELIDAVIRRTIENEGAVVMVSHDAVHLGDRAHQVMTLSAGTLEPVT